MLAGCYALYRDTSNAYMNDGFNNIRSSLDLQVNWLKPKVDWIALNIEGSALTNSGQAEFCGLIRNHEENFILGFSGLVRISNIMHADLMALLRGPSLCWYEGFRKVKCYTDSLEAIRLIEEYF